MTNETAAYDLEERSTVFAENVIDFRLSIPLTPITSPLIVQFVKSATSIGANYDEAAPLRVLWQETRELHLIFCKIIRTTDTNLRRERANKNRSST